MADPIKHDTASTIATGATSAVKGAAKGAGLIALIGAAGGAILGAGVLALGAAVFSGAAAAGTAALIGAGIGAVIGGAGTLMAGATGAGTLGTTAAVFTGGGALLGLSKGGQKVSKENQKYANTMAQKQHRQEIAVNNAGMAGMQQGYQAGYAEGQMALMNELRAYQEQMLTAQAQQQQQAPASAEQAAGGHAARIAKEREAAAEAIPQRG